MLEGYKRKGKKLVSPINQLGIIRDASWDKTFPELLCIAAIQHKYGVARSIELVHDFCEFIVAETNHKWPPFMVSDFIEIPEPIDLHGKDEFDWFVVAQAPLANNFSFYPPAQKILGQYEKYEARSSVDFVRDVVVNLQDKRSEFSTYCMATWMSIMGRFGKIVFTNNVQPPDLNALLHYPHTDDSQRVASMLRATLNSYKGPEDYTAIWPRRFFDHAFALADCDIDDIR